VLATTVPDNPRSLEAHELAAAWGPGAEAVADPSEALESGLAAAIAGGGPLIVCGSLYLVGHVRKLLLDPA
jgi:folylpolyglutamate synthase/dihydropteroate synthase